MSSWAPILVPWRGAVVGVFLSLWTESAMMGGWFVLPSVLSVDLTRTKELTAYLTSTSNWAGAALAGILATGAYNAYRGQ